MNRTEKKCLLGSALFHGTLAAVFLFGSAFVTPRLPDPPLVIEIVPPNAIKFTDGPSTGGNPNVAPAPAPLPKPPVPAPLPPQPKPPEPKPVKETVQPKELERKVPGDEPDPDKKKLVKKTPEPTNHLSQADLKVVIRSRRDAAAQARKAAQEREAREYAERMRALQRVNDGMNAAVSDLGKGLGTGTVVSVADFGPGGGGPAVANWRGKVGDIFTRAWEPPQDAANSAKVEARVTIARDGTVMSSTMVRRSGDSALDRSVERVLREVRSVPPFPEGAREERRILNIIFDLTVKRALG